MISVIVPVYNVKPYLRRCLDSLAAQTFDDLELIVVDDGSDDGSGELCDEFARTYERQITVVHQDNCGLSAARNVGLRLAKGDHIGFVDSDDWIEPDMFSELYRCVQETGAQIAACGVEFVWEWKKKRQEICIPEHRIFTREEAVRDVAVGGFIRVSVWNKLFTRKILEGIWFAEGRTFEDSLIMPHILQRVDRLAVLNRVFYHYTRRKDSICGSYSFRVHMERFPAKLEAAWQYYRMFPSLRPELCERIQYYLTSLLQKGEREDPMILRECAPFVRKSLRPWWRCWRSAMSAEGYLPLSERLKMDLFFVSPVFYFNHFGKDEKETPMRKT